MEKLIPTKSLYFHFKHFINWLHFNFSTFNELSSAYHFLNRELGIGLHVKKIFLRLINNILIIWIILFLCKEFSLKFCYKYQSNQIFFSNSRMWHLSIQRMWYLSTCLSVSWWMVMKLGSLNCRLPCSHVYICPIHTWEMRLVTLWNHFW